MNADYYLMQLSGSFVQSTLHLNRSQVIQPIGGVNTSPLSSAFVKVIKANKSSFISDLKFSAILKYNFNKNNIKNVIRK